MYSSLDKACNILNQNYSHVLEFGVYKGGTIRFLRKKLSEKYKIFGFDSFIGLPEDWTGTPCIKGEFNADGIIPYIENVSFFKGWFNETLPQYLNIAEPIALLHIDCDLYSSTKTILYSLKNYINPGTVIVFDEWYYNFKDINENRQHEQKAFLEWSIEYNINYRLLEEIEIEKRIIIIN